MEGRLKGRRKGWNKGRREGREGGRNQEGGNDKMRGSQNQRRERAGRK